MASRKRRRASEPPPPDWSSRAPWIVALIALLVFLPAVGNEFVNWDDDRNFLDNQAYRGLAPQNIEWAFSTFLLGHYHPLTWLTLEVDYFIWGLNPAGYHFTNALLHAGTAFFVYLLFFELIRRSRREENASASTAWGAAFGALLFALHPLRVESVAWASERRDVLSGLFYVLTAWLYVQGRLAASLGAFVAALMSKVIVATLPVVLLILDIYPLRRKPGLRLAPYFALSLVFGLIGVGRYEAGVAGVAANLDLYPDLRLMLSVWGLFYYVFKSVWPVGLYPMVVPTADPQSTDPHLLLAAAAVVALTVLAVWLWRRGKLAFPAAWAAYVVTLLPVLSLLRLDRQQSVADHHSYLATLGLAALAGGAWARWREQNQRAVLVAAATLVLLAGLTIRQIGFWSDSETLWSRTAEAYPEAIVAHNNLGRALTADGRRAEAIASFQRAVAVDPGYAHAQYNLGAVLMQENRLEEAEQAFRASLQSEPSFAQGWSDLGNCLLRQRRIEEAIAAYDQALEVDPGFEDARHNRQLAMQLR